MNYTNAGDAPNGTDVLVIRKFAPAISHRARTLTNAGDVNAPKVLAHLAQVVTAVQFALLVDLNANAGDAALDTAVSNNWTTIQAVANVIAAAG